MSDERDPSLASFTAADLAATRLARLYVYGSDLATTPHAAKAPKQNQLDIALADVRGWSEEHAPTEDVSSLEEATADPTELLALLGRHRALVAAPVAVLLEAFVGIKWDGKLRWSEGQPERAMQVVADALAGDVVVSDLLKWHRKAVKRLRQDSASVTAQVTMGTIYATLTAATMGGGGAAANVVGTAIGTHVLGYSGAAATSAGLALLGGGSIASGGLGMAGGGWLIWGTGHAASRGSSKLLGVLLAESSSALLVAELAKLDVRVRFDPSLREELVESLTTLLDELRAEWQAKKPPAGERLDRIGQSLTKMVTDVTDVGQHAKSAWQQLPDKEERNLAAAVRATEYELRHLTSPEWKRVAAVAPRMMGMPLLNRLVDKAEVVYRERVADAHSGGAAEAPEG